MRLIFVLLLTLSAIPALLLGLERIRFENDYKTVGLVMDYTSVRSQARENGIDEDQLLRKYKEFGVGGIAIFETTLARLITQGKVVYRAGSDWRNERLALGQDVTNIKSDEFYLRSLTSGVAEAFRDKYNYKTHLKRIDGLDWITFPVDVIALSAGPDLELIEKLKSFGFFIVYRPADTTLAAKNPGADFPNVPYIIYAGSSVTGYGDNLQLDNVRQLTKRYITGFIEATEQRGIKELAQNPIVRVFSIRPEWQALLQPDEVASKFVLAARERNHRLLYLRPFSRINDTEAFITKIKDGLDKAKLRLGLPTALEYQPNDLLRKLSLIGPAISLIFMLFLYHSIWFGLLAVATSFGVSYYFGGLNYDGAALLAAIIFPTLGFLLFRKRPTDWLIATFITVLGALFVAAIGTSREQILGLEAFRGVAGTLVLPPFLLILAMLPKQDIRKTIKDLWNTQVNLGFFALVFVALGAIALIVMRRGNTPAVGVSQLEIEVRNKLQDEIIRPRTKEIVLHPLAVLGLSGQFPLWFGNLLLLGGVIGQGSIIDSFAHYHTPLLISLLRTLNGLIFAVGLSVALSLAVWIFKWWWNKKERTLNV